MRACPRASWAPTSCAWSGRYSWPGLWAHTTHRAARPRAQRPDATILVDEAQNFLNVPPGMDEVLAESRGYRVSWLLAHQHLAHRAAYSMTARLVAGGRGQPPFTLDCLDLPDPVPGRADQLRAAAHRHGLSAAQRAALGRSHAVTGRSTWETRVAELGYPKRRQTVVGGPMSEHSAAFDHLIHWVDDLDAARSSYDEAGLPTHAALTMSGFRNAAWGVDDERYIELATVDDWDAVATSDYAEGLCILKAAIEARPASGLVTFAVDVPDVRAGAARLREAGHDVAEIEVRLEERNAGFVEAFVRDVPSYFPFFISYDPPRAEIARMRAEHRAAEGITFEGRPDLVALLVLSDAPEADARALAGLIGCEVDGSTVALPGAEVRFVRGTPAGLYGIVVGGLDSAGGAVTVAGVTVLSET